MRVEHYELHGCPVTVIHLWAEPEECNMCGTLGFHAHAVPWYCGPVMEGAKRRRLQDRVQDVPRPLGAVE